MKVTRLLLSSMVMVAMGVALSFAQTDTGAQPPAPRPRTIQQRKKNQQARIANGIRTGQLTPKEATNLEKKEGALNKEEHKMRTENGGKLTPADRAKLNHQQNKLSKQIYNKKHNARTGY